MTVIRQNYFREIRRWRIEAPRATDRYLEALKGYDGKAFTARQFAEAVSVPVEAARARLADYQKRHLVACIGKGRYRKQPVRTLYSDERVLGIMADLSDEGYRNRADEIVQATGWSRSKISGAWRRSKNRRLL